MGLWCIYGAAKTGVICRCQFFELFPSQQDRWVSVTFWPCTLPVEKKHKPVLTSFRGREVTIGFVKFKWLVHACYLFSSCYRYLEYSSRVQICYLPKVTLESEYKSILKLFALSFIMFSCPLFHINSNFNLSYWTCIFFLFFNHYWTCMISIQLHDTSSSRSTTHWFGKIGVEAKNRPRFR